MGIKSPYDISQMRKPGSTEMRGHTSVVPRVSGVRVSDPRALRPHMVEVGSDSFQEAGWIFFLF